MHNIFTAPAYIPIADIVAEYILKISNGDNNNIAGTTLIVPSRRATRTIYESFLKIKGDSSPIILPRIIAANDIEQNIDILLSAFIGNNKGDMSQYLQKWFDLPKPVSFKKRTSILAGIIKNGIDDNERWFDGKISLPQALSMAETLGSLIDDFYNAGADKSSLENVVIDEYAKHWQHSLEFLEIIMSKWPEWLASNGHIDEVEHRTKATAILTEYLQNNPPEYPVIIAGSTGSIRSTGELMAAIAKLDNCAVILPALDINMDSKIWREVDMTHPQYMMKRWLKNFGFKRENIKDISLLFSKEGAEDNSIKRKKLLDHIMLPATATEKWINSNINYAQEATDGIDYITCQNEEYEAAIITHHMRMALETPNTKTALITHDDALAKKVSSMLKYYDITVDYSKGNSLIDTTPVIFFMLVIQMIAARGDAASILSLLKHPLCKIIYDRPDVMSAARFMDKNFFRGSHNANNLKYWRNQLISQQSSDNKNIKKAIQIIEKIYEAAEELISEFQNMNPSSGDKWLTKHLNLCKNLNDDNSMWDHNASHNFSETLSEISRNISHLPDMDGNEYIAIISHILAKETYRENIGQHPDLHILSPIEARIQNYDFIILGGLNEGSWPKGATNDPWLNIPIRKDMGLPIDNITIGQSAHDIYCLMMCRKVLLTRAEKSGTSPTIPSRWLSRLDACLVNRGDIKDKFIESVKYHNHIAMLWLDGDKPPENSLSPSPKPPLESRPNKISATRLELLIRNPYGFYANKILKLRKLDPIAKPLGIADFGNMVHKVLEIYHQSDRQEKSSDLIYERLIEEGKNIFSSVIDQPGIRLFWWDRFKHIAKWISEIEHKQYENGLDKIIAEQELDTTINLDSNHKMEITARVDRIEKYKNNKVVIADYKTGTIPANKYVKRGVACQLPVAAMLWRKNEKDAIDMHYWSLKIREDQHGVIAALGTKADADMIGKFINDFSDSLTNFLLEYLNNNSAFLVRPNPDNAPQYDDYEHLSRIKEWG